jgi:hypothetical protein
MVRTAIVCAVVLAGAGVLSAFAEDTKVIITVDRPEGDAKPAKPSKPPFAGTRASVDVALLLDTSNSMDGLISQAKSQLWTIVEQFAKAKKNGQTPVLRVALFEYGNTRLPAAEGYIRQVVPLTDDLDKLSEALFALSTSGGDEYCGQVIDEAITRLDWSEEKNGYKAIFIAGNEPFTQGPVDYHDACRRAIGRGIIVNTIHCGANDAALSGMWPDGAKLAEGEFFNIDQDRAVVNIRCPQDEIIIKLNAELNKTYLWYGARDERLSFAANQAAQDANAKAAGPAAAAQRVVVKSGEAYSNRSRDLVDSVKENRQILLSIKEDELPEELKGLTPKQREARVQEMATKRAEVQSKINALAAEREAFLIKERKRLATEAGAATLGDVVVTAVQKQLSNAGFAAPASK